MKNHSWQLIMTGLLLSGGGLLAGCAGNGRDIEPRLDPITDLQSADADAKAEAVHRDPVGYLRQVAERCRSLEQYTLKFTRHERRGLFAQMHGRSTSTAGSAGSRSASI